MLLTNTYDHRRRFVSETQPTDHRISITYQTKQQTKRHTMMLRSDLGSASTRTRPGQPQQTQQHLQQTRKSVSAAMTTYQTQRPVMIPRTGLGPASI